MVKALNCALKIISFCANQCKTTKEITMCLGPSSSEKKASAQAAADARIAAEDRKRKEIEEKAEKKREDIGEALEARTEERGMAGGSGRRSLFQASGGGFLGRYS